MYLHSTVCKAVPQVAFPEVAGISLLLKQIQHRLSAHSPASVPCFTDLVERPRIINEGVTFAAPQPLVALVADASDLGRRAHLDNFRTQGLWSQEELSLHITVKELKVIHLACKGFLSWILGLVMQV